VPVPPSMPARVYISTLGCPKNEADSQDIRRALVTAGALVVDSPDEATHILLNTCGFIREAKEESIAAILEACNAAADRRVVVMGCLVERYRKELEAEIPEVAGWFGVRKPGPGGLRELLQVVEFQGSAPIAQEKPSKPSSLLRAEKHTRSYAYIKVSDGCDEPCTFCAIPGIKGSYEARSFEEIRGSARDALDEGARELVLVGQDTAIWRDGTVDLAGLVDRLAEDERVSRIRIMYLQPEHVSDSLLRYMATQPKLCRYLDVPFQHAHPEVLRRMGRAGTADSYLGLLARARRLMPDISIRSAFIVGFPGERDEHFDALLDFVAKARFDHGGGFIYSPEEGTVAASLRPRVAKAVSRTRLNRLVSCLEEKAELGNTRFIGATIPVMMDSVRGGDGDEESEAVGRTMGQAPEVDGVIYVEGTLPEGTGAGDVLNVEVTGVVGYDLFGSYDAA